VRSCTENYIKTHEAAVGYISKRSTELNTITITKSSQNSVGK